MNNNIDDLFNKSETEKELELRPELWRKLERRLDEVEEPVKHRFSWRPWMVAASFLLLVGFSAIWTSSKSYHLEDLSTDQLPGFTKEQLVFEDLSRSLPYDFNG